MIPLPAILPPLYNQNMDLGRRRFLGVCAAAATARAQTRPAPRARTGPVLCLDSRLLLDVDYSQLGTMLNGLGFDGCDLLVEAGGTVDPAQSPVDMVRAVEVITGSGLEVPVITTGFFNVNEPWARNVLALCGRSGVLFFRTGYSRYPERMAQRPNDVAGLMSYGRAAGIALALPYPAAESLIRGFDPAWVGYDFDPSQGNVESALPRMRTIVLRDVRKEGGQMVPCPLGEGTVDWAVFFGALAHAKFSGPLTIRITYPAADRLDAIRRDLAFARKQLNTAYQKELSLFDSAH
jgi:L-ribulose-5-phosphate 3-epimerase